MNKKGICPVCGSKLYINEYGEYGIGTVEMHNHCSKCTFREEMAYSKPLYFISETDTEPHKKKAKELGIQIISKDIYDQIG